ncbi:unnamed protein product [Euphydryas editha]|uniref:Uncharacterized protein n=1 Tax=Euphydryas editha TaxID=104508 RepID=A0AAU9TEM6_EUPED|nr:unnamed protein product [Euphydryas editha]
MAAGGGRRAAGGTHTHTARPSPVPRAEVVAVVGQRALAGGRQHGARQAGGQQHAGRHGGGRRAAGGGRRAAGGTHTHTARPSPVPRAEVVAVVGQRALAGGRQHGARQAGGQQHAGRHGGGRRAAGGGRRAARTHTRHAPHLCHALKWSRWSASARSPVGGSTARARPADSSTPAAMAAGGGRRAAGGTHTHTARPSPVPRAEVVAVVGQRALAGGRQHGARQAGGQQHAGRHGGGRRAAGGGRRAAGGTHTHTARPSPVPRAEVVAVVGQRALAGGRQHGARQAGGQQHAGRHGGGRRAAGGGRRAAGGTHTHTARPSPVPRAEVVAVVGQRALAGGRQHGARQAGGQQHAGRHGGGRRAAGGGRHAHTHGTPLTCATR